MPHRIIVAGAGIIGASIAYYLTKRGADVTILEQNRPASGATSKSFGWINANFPESTDYFQLRTASMDEYHNLAVELDKNIGLKWGGSLWWECVGRKFDRHVQSLERYGYPVKKISTEEFAHLEPNVENRPALSAHFPSEGAVDPIACTHAMISLAKQAGATLVTGCEVTNLVRERDCCTGVETSMGQFKADTVVVAIGASAESFLYRSNIYLPMNNPTGLVVHTQPVEPVINHLLLSPDLHFRQHTNGSLVIAEDYGGGELSSDPMDFAQKLISRIYGFLPRVGRLEIREITIGKRPVPGDGYPVLGSPANMDGLYIASMHSGVTLAPIIGKIAAMEILEGKLSEMFAPYRLARFS